MKLLMAILSVGFCVSAFASSSVTPKQWVCDGEGFDPRTMDYRSVPGQKAPTLKEARENAVQFCTAMRLMGCFAKNCRQTSGLIRAVVAPESSHWFCTAEGLDQNMQRRSISGDYKTTEKLARADALKICQMLYMACSVKSCFGL